MLPAASVENEATQRTESMNTSSGTIGGATNGEIHHGSKIMLEKIKWISQDSSAIYSVDIHPDNTRFASCQGEKIYIWRSSNYVNSSIDHEGDNSIVETPLHTSLNYSVTTVKTDSRQYLLKEISVHNSNVNCIRFSPSGKYIAAASDDHTVSLTKMIKPNTPKEDWKHFKIFKAHTSDVLSVAWSYDSRYLASCSVDNRVVVYDLLSKNNVGEVVLETQEHEDHVKGLAFDPIGKYLVSQSDKLACIWLLADNKFLLQKKISQNFSSVSGMYYRPSFSPCGQLLLLPNAFNRGSHGVVALMRQDNFEKPLFYCGHDDLVTCANFSPILYRNPKKADPVHVYAAASQDSSLSIWSSVSAKPLTLAKKLFTQTITDLAWSPDGMSILLSSTDGTVLYLGFPKDYFGTVMNKQDKQKLLERLYGEVGASNILLEHPTITFRMPSDSSSLLTVASAKVAAKAPSTSELKPVEQLHKPPTRKVIAPVQEQKQQVTITAQGKKRITPVLVSTEDDEEEQERQENARSSSEIVTTIGFGGMDTDINPPSFIADSLLPVDKIEVTKKRTRLEAPEPQDKKNRKKNKANPVHTSLIPTEPLYLKINTKDELFCSLDGIVEYKSNGVVKWKSTISGTSGIICNYPIMAAATNDFISICTFPSNQCHVFSTRSGMRLLPPMILDSKVEHLNCTGNYLVVYTLELMFYLWDMKKLTCLVRASVDSLLSNSGLLSEDDQSRVVDDVAVTPTGVGIVTLMNGESYAFDRNLQTWVCVADSHSVFSPFLSQGIATQSLETDSDSDDDSDVTLKMLRRKAAKALKKFKLNNPELASQATSETVNMDTIDDLEVAMTSAASIGDKDTYIYCVKAYVKHLAKQPKDNRLKDLFNFLLGPVTISPFSSKHLINTPSQQDWEPFIAGIPKRAVLKELIVLLSTSSFDVNIQRICKEYGDIITNLAI